MYRQTRLETLAGWADILIIFVLPGRALFDLPYDLFRDPEASPGRDGPGNSLRAVILEGIRGTVGSVFPGEAVFAALLWLEELLEEDAFELLGGVCELRPLPAVEFDVLRRI